jgi:predicted regulator of Ras-like GTPase activity (Roadblock/LC7/MglB family)
LQELMTMGTDGYSQIWFIDEDNALACLCDKGVNIGALGVHMKIASQRLKQVLE